MEAPDGKKFYGSVTVSERGQIAIPSDARKDFDIKTGDKLLIFGDIERGLAIATVSLMQKTMKDSVNLFREVGLRMDSGDDADGKTGKLKQDSKNIKNIKNNRDNKNKK
jgi:AbrB family looped-hinge helix DNA binding protein